MNEYPQARFGSVDIFCRVVDNFGDIGVCWRLARQLHGEYGLAVRLWVDRPEILGALLREYDYSASHCFVDGIEVCAWALCAPATVPAEVVIEAFACEIPDFFQQAMAARRVPPLWINLEYLSAEGWVEGCHGLPSRHPRLPLQKHFFFPGFSAATGGLLRERGLAAARRDFLAGDVAGWLAARGVRHEPPGALPISLFAYEQPALAALLPAWQASPRPIALRVPEGRVLGSLAAVLGRPLAAGDCLPLGALTLNVLPFLSQQDYDCLLWACELNCVRGEDSFVRAQWAAQPLLWHIYPQQDEAHAVKLEAFLQRYGAGLGAEDGALLGRAWRAWNGCGAAPGEIARDWPALLQALPRLQAHARAWDAALQGQADLAEALVQFCNARVK